MNAQMNLARIIAEALASHMAQGEEVPPVEEIGAATAQFAISTPAGRYRIDVTTLDAEGS